jgi:pimeloyl-ACP methyl ester carboxylesterase
MGRANGSHAPSRLEIAYTKAQKMREEERKKRTMPSANSDMTVVLVHAAWADGSSWNKVTEELQRKGFHVVAAQIPLTSFTDEVAMLKKMLLHQKGPIVLAGHSYGGAVITAAATANSNVKALVYVAAIVPDEGETVGDVFCRVPAHPGAPKLEPDSDGFLWLTVDAFRTAFAPNATASETALMAATQKPISAKCLGEPMAKPAWKEKPSWFLIAEKDIMLSPETQRFTAARMKSTIVSLPIDHHPLASKPDAVVELITVAAATV